MRVLLARVEVQRVLIMACTFWLVAGAALGVPFARALLLAAAGTLWTFLLGWSLLAGGGWTRPARVLVGLALAAACASAYGASPATALGVALATGLILGGAEHLMGRRVAA